MPSDRVGRPVAREPSARRATGSSAYRAHRPHEADLLRLHQAAGNRAVAGLVGGRMQPGLSSIGRVRIQRQVAVETLRDRMGQMRAENLMVLYVDSVGSTTHELYHPRSGMGTRRAYSASFLRRPATRRLLMSEFRGAVDWLVSQRRWETLYWLHTEFPSRHLADAPERPLNELKRYIQRRAGGVRAGAGTGWDEVLGTPERRGARAQAAAEQTRRTSAEITGAIGVIGQGLTRASGSDAHFNVFSSEGARTAGGHAHGLPRNWAEALVRYLRTINELRKGRRPSASAPIPGAPVPITAYMVGAGTRTWERELSSSQRRTLADDGAWAEVVRGVWPTFTSRLRWGLEEAGYDLRPDQVGGGRWRNPPQSLF